MIFGESFRENALLQSDRVFRSIVDDSKILLKQRKNLNEP